MQTTVVIWIAAVMQIAAVDESYGCSAGHGCTVVDGPGRSWMACVSWMDGWICWRMHLHVAYGFQDVVRVSSVDVVDAVGVGSLEHTPVVGSNSESITVLALIWRNAVCSFALL
jgi:hypothetical protein